MPTWLIWTIPWPDEKDLFLKFAIRETQKPQFYVWKTKVLGKLQKTILFYTLTRMVILHNNFGLIWTTPWTDE